MPCLWTDFSVLAERIAHFGGSHVFDKEFDKPVVDLVDGDESLRGNATSSPNWSVVLWRRRLQQD